MDWLMRTEKPITSKTRLLRTNTKSFKHFINFLSIFLKIKINFQLKFFKDDIGNQKNSNIIDES